MNYSANANLNAGQALAAIRQLSQAARQFSEQLAAASRASVASAASAQNAIRGSTDRIRGMAQQTGSVLSRLGGLLRINRGGLRDMGDSADFAMESLQGLGRSTKGVNDRFAWMPKHTQKVEKALLNVSSASQGVMLGMGLMNGSVQSVAFGLIFLRWSLLPIAALYAAMVVAILSAVRAMGMWINVVKQATAAGKDFERTGQQLASYFQSNEIATAIMEQADLFSRTFGVARTESIRLFESMQRMGLSGRVYAKAFGNIAKATNQAADAVSMEFEAAVKSGGEAVTAFAKKYDLGLGQVSNTLEVARAANERFKNSLEDWAETTAGLQTRLMSTWGGFLVQAGRIFNEIFKTIYLPLISVVDGMIEGFRSAEEGAKASGELTKTLDELRNAAKALLPYLFQLGVLLGRMMFKTAMIAARGLKIFYDVIRAGLKFIKEWKDEMRAAGSSFKTHFLDNILSFKPEIVLAALSAFGRSFVKSLLLSVGDDTGSSIFKRIFKGVLASPKAFFAALFKGAKAGLITAVLEALALTAIDMLPLSDQWKASLEGMVRAAFLGAAIGSIIPGVGSVLGFAIGGAIAGGLELIQPGLSKKVFDWADAAIVSSIKTAFSFMKDAAIPAIVDFGSAVISNLSDAGKSAVAFGKDVYTAVAPAVITIAQNIWDLVTAFKDGLVAELGGPVSQVVDALIRVWRDSLLPLIQSIVSFISTAVVPLLRELAEGWWLVNGSVLDVVVAIGQALMPFFLALVEFIGRVLLAVIGNLAKFLADVLVVGIAAVGLAVDVLRIAFEVAGFFIRDVLVPILSGFNDNVLSPISSVLQAVADVIRDHVVPRATDMANYLSQFLNPAAQALADIISGITSLPSTIFDNLVKGFKGVKDMIDELLTPLRDAVGMIEKVTGAKIPGIGSVGGFFGGIQGAFGEIPFFAHGGTVQGPPGSKRLVVAEAGERFYGHPTFNRSAPGDGGGITNVSITIDARDSIVSSDRSLTELADRVAGRVFESLRQGRSVTQVRAG